MSDWWGFRPSRPVATDEGIAARTRRGAFVKHWWASRWIEAMEAVMDRGRLQRGRAYARKGQVVALDEVKGGIEARVQGSRPRPYTVKLALAPLSARQWDAVTAALGERPDLVADLLVGEMPHAIESAFEAAGVALFPAGADEVEVDCSCPDWAGVCKHVAAAQYILAERFDDDPFLLFRLRGRSEAEVLDGLRSLRAVDTPDGGQGGDDPAAPGLLDSVDDYWRAGRALRGFESTVAAPALPLPVLKRLGPPPFAEPDVDVARLLGPAYAAFSRWAVAVAEAADAAGDAAAEPVTDVDPTAPAADTPPWGPRRGRGGARVDPGDRFRPPGRP